MNLCGGDWAIDTYVDARVVIQMASVNPSRTKRWQAGSRVFVVVLVLGVFGTLLALAPVWILQSREAARRALRADRLSAIGQAIRDYKAVHGEPPRDRIGPNGEPLLSWRVAILPFLRARDLGERFRLDEPWDSAHNRALIRQVPAEFTEPVALVRGRGIAAVMTETGRAEPWTRPDGSLEFEDLVKELTDTPQPALLALFADGSVRRLSREMSPRVLAQLIDGD